MLSSPSWELELRPLGVATGNALSVTRSEDTYEKIPPVGRRQPMTSLPACHNISAAGQKHHQFFVFTDWFVWSVQSESGKSTVFLSTMASTSKAFRKCVDPCPRYLTRWHTRLLRLLFGHGARTRCLWGGGLRALWAAPYEDALLSPVPLFEERGAAVCFPRFKSHRCRGTEENEIVGLLGGSSRWVWKGAFPFTRVGKERERAARLWWCNLSDIIWSGG